jgi:hypothetical protein
LIYKEAVLRIHRPLTIFLLTSTALAQYGPVGTAVPASRMVIFQASSNVSSDAAKPVIVHAPVDSEGNVVAEELSIASDPALAPTALDAVKAKPFPPNGNIREIYVEVRFVSDGQ